MIPDELLQNIYPKIGGKENVSREVTRENVLYLTVKDIGAVDLEAVQQMEGVAAAELSRGRLTIYLQKDKEDPMATKINKYEAIAPQILELVGGKDNIQSFVHCMTRLRFNVRDKSLVDAEKIGKLPGCMGTQWAGNQLQVIIGQAVDKAYDAICAAGGLKKENAVDENLDEGGAKKKLSLTAVCESISGCIVPLIPLFMASGLIKVVLVLANLIGILPTDSSTYTVLGYAADAALYFMPILIGYTAAKKFGADPSLAMGLCALLVYPSLMTALGGETPVTIFGLPVYNATYTNMMFPSIMVVFVMGYVERFFKKIVPEILRVMLVPLGTFLIMLPLTLCVVAPAGVFLGDGITWLVETIYDHIGFLGVGVLSGLYPLLILTGMHSTLATVCMAYFMKYQYDPLIIPACYIANFGQAAAAAAVTVKSKNADVKGIAGSSALTAFLAGVTEPALFGVNFRYRKPLIASVIGGFVGGCYAGLVGCKLITMSGLGVFALAGFIGSDIMNFVNYVIAAVITMVVTFAITFITYKDEA